VLIILQPHILQGIRVLTAGHENEAPWLITEWIKDGLGSIDLNDHDVPTILNQVSKGLAYIYVKGFTHRDLKQDNILI
jgi:serine/threonine protein kinase